MSKNLENKTVLTTKKVRQAFTENRKTFIWTYRIFTLIFIVTFLIAFMNNYENRNSQLTLSGILLLLSIGIGFLYPWVYALNWRNQTQSETKTIQYQISPKRIEFEDQKIKYDQVRKIIHRNGLITLVTRGKEELIILDEKGFNSESEMKRFLEWVKRG